MNSDSSDSENDLNVFCTTPDDKGTSIDLLTEKSKKKYETAYRAFMDWRTLNNFDSFSENVLLAYFKELSEKYKSTSLWAHYSMLRSKLIINNGTNIENYSKLRAYLKHLSEGYQPKRAKVFTPDQINKFINEAPDIVYLATKVALIMGIMGGCRRYELHAMTIENIKDFGSAMLVTIPKNRSKIKKFTLTDNFYKICKKYVELRPTDVTTTSFFLNYHNGKCTTQQIGINKFGAMGKEIAKFLQLPNPELYTGHSFRRSSAILFVDSVEHITILEKNSTTSTVVSENTINDTIKTEMDDEIYESMEEIECHDAQKVDTNENGDFTTVLVDGQGNVTTVNRHSDLKSTLEADGKIDDATRNRAETAQNFFESTKQSSRVYRQITSAQSENINVDINSTPSLNFTNCSNFTINIVTKKCKCDKKK